MRQTHGMNQSEDEPLRLCFVCLGNICRSPTAEGVMRSLVENAGLSSVIEVTALALLAGTAVNYPTIEHALKPVAEESN